jgi:hypothetical protein
MMRRLRGSATPADELREEISKHLSILMDAGLIDLQALSAPTRQIANCHVDGRDPTLDARLCQSVPRGASVPNSANFG